MSEIKSKNSILLIDDNAFKQNCIDKSLIKGQALMGDDYTYISKSIAIKAIIIAETELSEHHEMDMKKLRDRGY